MSDSRKGTVHGIAAFIPGLRYRKALQVSINPLDLHDDHLKVIPGQEYPRWLREVHPNRTPYIELMDYEFEANPDGTDRTKVILWAVPNRFSRQQTPEIICEWTCTNEFLVATRDPWAMLLVQGIRKRVK